MKTNDLIDRLGANLAPVDRLPDPGRRASFWMSGAAVYLAAVVLSVSRFTRADWAIDAGFIGTQLLGVLAAGIAVWAALASVIPGRSGYVRAVALLAVAVWLATFSILAAVRDAATVSASQEEWVCVAMILLGGAPLVLSLGAMLRKGAPMNPLQSGILLGVGVGLLANFAACLSSLHTDMSVALVWHVGAIGALIAVCGLGCRAVFNWRNRV